MLIGFHIKTLRNQAITKLFNGIKLWCLIIGCIFCLELSGNAISKTEDINFTYKRINFILPQGKAMLPDEKFIIDSLFAFSDRTLQKAESQIGYKTSGDIYFELCFNEFDYREALQKTQIWQDFSGTELAFSVDKTFPLALYLGYQEMSADIIFYTNYFLLQEFLGGFGIKQRISNSESRHLPKWLTLGYCAIQSSNWSAFDEDEYSYFEQNGAFAKLQSIPARAQLIFGKYLWSQLIKQNHSNSISSFWFIIKFTQSIDEAYQFQFHESFDNWYSQIRLSKAIEKFKTKSEVGWTKKFKYSPIIDLIKDSKSHFYAITYECDYLNVYKIDTVHLARERLFRVPIVEFDSKRRLEGLKMHIDSMNNTLIVERVTGGFLTEFQINLKNKKLKTIQKFSSLIDDFHGFGFHLNNLLDAQSKQYYWLNNENIIKSFETGDKVLILSQMKIQSNEGNNKWKYLLKFSIFDTSKSEIKLHVLRIDTLDQPIFIKSIAQETQNRYSYADGSSGVWKLRFIEFEKNQDLKWHLGIKGSFFNHKTIGNTIWEISYDSRFPFIEQFEVHSESKQEIISLIKQSLEDETYAAFTEKTDSTQAVKLMPFEFIGKFPRKSWESRLKSNKPLQYSGEFQIRRLQHSYYLKHAALQFSNYENHELGYYISEGYNQLVNSPITPNLKLEVTDIHAKHNILLHYYTLYTLGRMGLQFQQSIKINPTISLQQSFNWRIRSFSLSDISFYKNTLFYSDLAIIKMWDRKFNSSIGLEFRSDGWYQKLSSVRSVALLNDRLDIGTIKISTQYKFTSSLFGPNIKVKGEISPMVRVNYCRNLNLSNSELSLKSNIEVNLHKNLYFNSLLISSIGSGKYRNQYFIGGTEGWIGKEQYINSIPPFRNNYPTLLTRWGGTVRGHLIGSSTGSSFLVYNGDLRFSLKGIFPSGVELSQFIKQSKLGLFFDAGMAYYYKSPSDLRNPHNTLFTGTGNFDLWTSAKRNPWLTSFGFSFQTSIMGIPMKYEYAIPFKQNERQKNTHLVGLIWEI